MPTFVAIDGSDRALDALALGRRLAEAKGGELVIATVTPDPAEGERRLARYLREARTIHLESADPAAALHRAAREHGAAFIVLGASGRGAAGRALPGATVERLLALGDLAVAVAPRGYWWAAGRSPTVAVPETSTLEIRSAAKALAERLGGGVEELGTDAPERLAAAGLLACGVRSHARSAAALLDHVAATLVRHARCPVLAFPRGAAIRLEQQLLAAH